MLAKSQLFSGSSLFIPVLKPPLTFSQPRTLHPLPCLSSTEPLHVSLAQEKLVCGLDPGVKLHGFHFPLHHFSKSYNLSAPQFPHQKKKKK